MSDDTIHPKGRLGTTRLAAATREHLIAQGVPANHPVLGRTLSRRVREMLESGLLPHVRHRGRYYVDPSVVPEAARHLRLNSAA